MADSCLVDAAVLLLIPHLCVKSEILADASLADSPVFQLTPHVASAGYISASAKQVSLEKVDICSNLFIECLPRAFSLVFCSIDKAK